MATEELVQKECSDLLQCTVLILLDAKDALEKKNYDQSIRMIHKVSRSLTNQALAIESLQDAAIAEKNNG